MGNKKRGLKAMEDFENQFEKKDYSNVGEGLPKEYLSFSQIDLYRRCAKAYEFRYVMDEQSPAVINMIQGRSIHHALEVNYKQKIDSKTDLESSDVIDAFITDYDKESPGAEDASTKEKAIIKDQSVSFLGKYQEKYSPKVQPIKVEERFQLDITPNLKIVGFIDLIQEVKTPLEIVESKLEDKKEIEKLSNRDKVIVDHKVTSKKKAQNDADSSLQLSIYSMALDIPDVRFDSLIASPKTGGSDKQKVTQTLSHRTPKDLEFDKGVILSVAEAISAGVFPKTGQGTWVCSKKFCPHFDRCHQNK